MKRGFQTESHVVVYCDICGDVYTERGGSLTCFATTSEAIGYLTRRAGLGWVYDGDRVICDACLATRECQDHGHDFPARWTTTVWPLGEMTHTRACTRCGVPENETEVL
ncbi:Uncharacterised protein [Nocardia farcinica]|uniref:Uncharacterized protein n=1 Tax=Nocardia farcinica TaxID=37329 RepID=A0A449GLZ3_NOCFR|nr:hypothetical protein [Nocardia farcinica]VFA93572.1 Uncharacterised protein [Nocardia farcinica]